MSERLAILSGSPTVPAAGRDSTYDPHDYPEATRMRDDSPILGSERYPLAGQDPAVMPYTIRAVQKVYNALNTLVAAETEVV